MMRRRSVWPLYWGVCALLLAPLLFAAPERAQAATFPAGFADALVATVASPTALAFTPDGRMLIATQPGQLYVKQGEAPPALVMSLPNVCFVSERGLDGLAVDPNYATNRYIYLYYTHTDGAACTTSTVAQNRVSRFTLSADNVVTGETVLIDKITNVLGVHNGGSLRIGKDGYLYIGTGDNGDRFTSRQLNRLSGKILRIATDGSIPPTNPYRGGGTVSCAVDGRTTPDQACQEIYASGLRNPFRMAFDPDSPETRFFINDVGDKTWEEINIGQPGADYGWNLREGNCEYASTTVCGSPPAGMTDPLYSYGHDSGCTSITGGAFVPAGVWPTEHSGYLFSDYACGKIFLLQPNGTAWNETTLADDLGTSSAVHLEFGPFCGTQALYYTTYADGGQVRRLAYNPAQNCPPSADLAAGPLSGPAPLTVDFDGSGSSDPNGGDTVTYLWDFGDGATAATAEATTSHTYTGNGDYTAALRVRDDKGLESPPATVQISVGNTRPVPTITAPAAGTFFASGWGFTLTGSAIDAEDGPLPDERLSWTILLHHNAHTHPLLGPVSGGSLPFTPPAHDDGVIWLEVQFTATDLQGVSATTSLPLYRFTDVGQSDPSYGATEKLAASGIINGYGPETCAERALLSPCFGPGDELRRDHLATALARVMGWDDEPLTNPFPDRAGMQIAFNGANGILDNHDTIPQIQVATSITRAMVVRGYWQRATVDDPTIYPNISDADYRLDLVTYVQQTGALPDAPANDPWASWDTAATRGWFARALWQALDDFLTP